jgi:hypothetical protein
MASILRERLVSNQKLKNNEIPNHATVCLPYLVGKCPIIYYTDGWNFVFLEDSYGGYW